MAAAALLGYWAWSSVTVGAHFFPIGVGIALSFAATMWILGFADDLYDLSALLRIVLQSTVCIFAIGFSFSLLPPTSWLGSGLSILSLAVAGSIWCVWFLNLYNFMDGIDGLAGGEAAIASLFFFVLFAAEGKPEWAVANLLISASVLGFLAHNWPPARVFMGDAGSSFLGAFYGMQSLVAPAVTGIPFIVFVLPFANFVADTTFTLLRRIWLGEKWYLAHRSHIYQRMTDLGMSHRKVAILELIVAALSCAAAALCVRAGIFGRVVVAALLFAGLGAAGLSVIRKENDLLVGQ